MTFFQVLHPSKCKLVLNIFLGVFLYGTIFQFERAAIARDIGHKDYRVPVVVWDAYFEEKSRTLREFKNLQNGKLKKNELNLAEGWFDISQTKKKTHAIDVSYVIAKKQPFLDIYPVYSDYWPWQDPEVCLLVKAPEFVGRLPNCLERAEQQVEDFSKYLKERNIRLVNMSHGSYYPNYIKNNRRLLKKTFPEIDQEDIDRVLLENYLKMGEVAEKLFENNQETVFVVAAGSNIGKDIDSQEYPDWYEGKKPFDNLPTWYSVFTQKYENVISVTSTFDGKILQEGSNWGGESVDLAVKNKIMVPRDRTKEYFTGSSAAAARLSRSFARAFYQWPQVEPVQLKALARDSVDFNEWLAEKVSTGGMFNEAQFFENLETLLGPPVNDFDPPAPDPEVHAWKAVKRPAKVIEMQGEFKEYGVDYLDKKGQPASCEMLDVAPNGIVWMTLTHANQVASYDPVTGEWQKIDLPTQNSDPDGITVDKNGIVWVGEYHGKKLVRIDPSDIDSQTGLPKVQEFAVDPARAMAIPRVDKDGIVWTTSHQGQRLIPFNSKTLEYEEPIKLDVGWPVDVLGDQYGQIWSSGNSDLRPIKSKSGALVKVLPDRKTVEYFALKNDRRKTYMTGSWLAQSENWVAMTVGDSGVFMAPKKGLGTRQVVRRDRKQNYSPAAANSRTGEFVFGNNGETGRSLDFYGIEEHSPGQQGIIHSYRLPTQGGKLKEGLAFAPNGHVWYCQNHTGIIGELIPSH